MKVILLQDVRGLGRKYEVKEVADGHARNFLIPRRLAQIGTPAALAELGKKTEQQAQADVRLVKHLTELARILNERHLEFELKTDTSGSIFGSVTKEMILKGLRSAGLVSKERVEIKLEHPLKTLGEHRIEVHLPKGVRASLKVIVRPHA